MAGVQIEAVSKRFGDVEVLRGVDLEVLDGEFVTLLGPSGCGKSTLLRIVSGLEDADAGTVAIGGRPMRGVEPRARDVAMVFQSYALYPHLTVWQNIALPLRMRRLTRLQRFLGLVRIGGKTRRIEAAMDEEVREVARSLQIDHLLSRKPAQLSGGQRQRVALGRAMIRRPGVFLMDEPLSSLDMQLRVAMRTEIVGLTRRLGTTCLFVTHDQAEAMTLSDRIAVMLEGRIRQFATPEALYRDPESLDVACFVGTPRINTLEGVVDGDGRFVCRGRTLFLAPPGITQGPVTAAVRPEDLSFASGAGLHASVDMVERLGPERLISVRCLDGEIPLTIRCTGETGADLAPGDAVRVAVDAGRVLLFGADGVRLRPARVHLEAAYG